jgi:NodT family efflux transporter outer membrane factor (OMF) lipoprotein
VRALNRISSSLLASAAVAGLCGCTVGPNFMRPAAPMVMGYTMMPLPAQTESADIAGGDAQRFLQDQEVPGQWWTSFRSDAVNGLVDQALRANPDLDAAQAALRQQHQLYVAQRGSLFPAVSGAGSATRERSTTTRATFDLFNASVSVSYLVDAFGGVRRSIEAQAAVEENQRFQLEATYNTLISNVITTALQEASLTAQIAATEDIVAAQQQELDLLNQQFQLGAVARGDVLQQQSQLAATQASVPPLEKQLEQVRNQLAVLLGRFPANGQVPNIQLADLKLPTDLPLSLPSKLVEQRPDIRAAESLLHAASADIGVATANELPQITLSGGVGESAGTIGNLFNGQLIGWNVAAGLTAPIFEGGKLEAQRQAAVDAFDKAAAQYRSTVLNAFANVANVLTALERDAETLKVQLYAEQTAQQSLDITMERFQAGAIAYLALLDAQRVYQQARIALVVAQANRYADTVALFEALGGGWWNRNDVQQAQTDGNEPIRAP